MSKTKIYTYTPDEISKISEEISNQETDCLKKLSDLHLQQRMLNIATKTVLQDKQPLMYVWLVLREDDKRILGCFNSEEKANNYRANSITIIQKLEVA